MFGRLFKNERGLTLVELLAVVVILGIISAIAVPSIGNLIQEQKDRAVVAEALNIIAAAKIAKVSDARGANTTQWTQTDLGRFLDKVNGTYTVRLTNNVWTINNDANIDGATLRDAVDRINGADAIPTDIPEATLAALID